MGMANEWGEKSGGFEGHNRLGGDCARYLEQMYWNGEVEQEGMWPLGLNA